MGEDGDFESEKIYRGVGESQRISSPVNDKENFRTIYVSAEVAANSKIVV